MKYFVGCLGELTDARQSSVIQQGYILFRICYFILLMGSFRRFYIKVAPSLIQVHLAVTKFSS